MIDLLGDATVSTCGLYRYRLTRRIGEGGRSVAIIMVNPSTADATTDDATIRKLLGFGRRLGWREIHVGNLFAYRATDVNELAWTADPIGPDNNSHLEAILRGCDLHVVGWGPTAKLPKHLRSRWRDLVAMAKRADRRLYCWGTARDGQPRHPLMIAYDTTLVEWAAP